MTELNSADAIRKRPGMYIGDPRDGSGLAHMVWEVVANAVDEHLAGACNEIGVEVDEAGVITVEDDGRGFPLELVGGKPFAELALTTFHPTPTLDGHAPHTHVSLHGVGVFAVCALSATLELHVHRHGRHWCQRFAKGHATSVVQDCGPSARTGTRLTFMPDATIFTGRGLDSTAVLERLTELSFLLPGLTLRFVDRRIHTLHEPRGLAGHLESTVRSPRVGSSFELTETVEDVAIEIAARWGSYGDTNVRSFANTERTTSGGTHVKGLLAGLNEGLKRSSPRFARLSATRRSRAVSSNLTALVCVRLNDATYDSPTKSILSTPRVQRIVKDSVAQRFAAFLAGEPQLVAHLANAAT